MLLGEIGFCAKTANIWAVLGYVVLMFKIIIPLLLIILGMVDLGKAVVSSDDKAISKSVSTLVKRFIAAILIFFIPSIVSALFNVLNLVKADGDYNICIQCVTNVNSKSDSKSNGKFDACYQGDVVGNVQNDN